VAGRIVHNQMSMLGLALLLSRFQRQTVRDLTELPGSYEVKLEWTPDTNRASPDPAENAAGTATPSAPSLFTAIQQQLGLRLEARKGPVDVLVVDRAEQKPAEN
jgi:uncharacterized protein (TIGR03435 family)